MLKMPAVTEDVRRTVLDASLALVAEEGLAALSMREVARRAGVSHQAPYHYFKDREAILAALAEEGYAKLSSRLKKAAKSAKTPTARLEATGRTYINFALSHPALFKIMHQSELVQLERHSEATTIAQGVFDMLVGIVEAAAGPKKSALDRNELAVAAWCLVHGASMLLLENRLQRKFPNARNKTAAATDSILQTFSAMIR